MDSGMDSLVAVDTIDLNVVEKNVSVLIFGALNIPR